MSDLPDALKPSIMKTVSTMSIETNILDPIIVNQNFVRFVLEKKGILDTGSVITFALQTTPGEKAFLPLRAGINSVVNRATLRIGSKIVAITDEYPHYQTIRRQFKTPEEKSQKDMIKSGTLDAMCPSNAGDGKYQVRDVNYNSTNTLSTVPVEIKLTDQSLGPIFSIKISDLFPMMRGVQLPLYLINEACSIELSLNTQANVASQIGTLACFPSVATNTEVKVNLDSIKFLADYLTYSDESMNETASLVMSEDGLVIPYEDIISTVTDYPALVTNPSANEAIQQNFSRDIGVSGMRVNAMLISSSSSVANSSNILLGKYKSDCFNVPESVQLRINDSQFFPRAIVSESQKAYQLSRVFNTDLSVLNCEYSNDSATDKTQPDNSITNPMIVGTGVGVLEGHNQEALLGRQHYIGIDLSTPNGNGGRGMMVSQKPIQLIQQVFRTSTNNSDRKMRIFSIVERVMVIKAGLVSVSV